MPRAVPDKVIETGEVLGLSDLVSGKLLGGHKVLEVPVVRKDQDGVSGTLKVVAPLPEGCKDCQELLVVYFIIEFSWCHAP